MNHIKYLQDRFANLPVQGSDEWLRNRSSQFGGSEIAALMGKNRYSSLNDVIKSKKVPTKNDNVACKWGHCFEIVAKHHLTKERHEEIFEFGSIPHSTMPIAYSPDGLVVHDNKIVLLEIKCPIMRGVSSIPEIYQYQIQTGMHVLQCHKTMFTQYKFRHCSVQQLKDDTRYNRWFHKESYKRAPECACVYKGFLWWDKNIPLTEIHPNMMGYGFKLFVNYEHNLEEEIEKLSTGSIMAFKCFEIATQFISKDNDFMDQIEDNVWSSYFSLVKTNEGTGQRGNPETCLEVPREEVGESLRSVPPGLPVKVG